MLKWLSPKPHKPHCVVCGYSNNVKDYYQILGIKRTSTTNEIKEAYYKMSKQYHPDLNPGDSNAANKFREISEAYEILTNIFTKSAYDASFGIKQRSSFKTKPSPANIKVKEDDYTQFYKRQREHSHSARTQHFYQGSRVSFEQNNASASVSEDKSSKETVQEENATTEFYYVQEYSIFSVLTVVTFVLVCAFAFSHDPTVNSDLKKTKS